MAKRLGGLVLGKDASRVLSDLADYVRERDATREWLDMLEREHGYLMALARLAAEQRKEQGDDAHQAV